MLRLRQAAQLQLFLFLFQFHYLPRRWILEVTVCVHVSSAVHWLEWHQNPFQNEKKIKKRYLDIIQHQAIYMPEKRLLVFEDKAHWRISKIFITLTWWYILLIHHHLLMAVTIWSPPIQVPCISLRHLFSFLLQTWHLEDHYMTYIGSFYKVLSCLDPVLS